MAAAALAPAASADLTGAVTTANGSPLSNVAVRAVDAAGNRDGSPATRTWTIEEPPVDTTAPDPTLDEHPDPTRAQAREAISGNLCRCTGYQNIVASVMRAAELRRERAT